MMEDKLIEYADKIVEALESGIDFAGEQAPLYVQELLSYAIYHHIIWITGLGLMFLLCLYVTINSKLKWDSVSWVDSTEWGVGTYLAGLTGIGLLFGLISHVSSLVKVTVAPRVYLIEKISSLF